MTASDIIRRLHAHRLWATASLRTACAGLSPEQLRTAFDIGRGSLWSTLIHLYGAELVWIEALLGRPDAPLAGDDAFDTVEELQIAWGALDRRWQRCLDNLTDARLDLPIYRKRAAGVVATPARDVLLHVCTHAHYTTAQGVNMLRRLGVPPDRLPDPQLMTMSRLEAREEA
jgi:uncharacterized damage-inducible protein DinB